MLRSLDNLIPYKILAVYQCGSTAYGLNNETSDEDYTVIVDNYCGADIIKDDGADYFVFGVSYFEKLKRFETKLTCFKVWIDNTVLAKANLVYIDDSFKEQFDSLIQVDWDAYFYKWLEAVVNYFEIRIEYPDKSLYHLIRIKREVQNFLETNELKYHVSEDDFALARAYRKNPQSAIPSVKEAFSYLKQILEEKKE